MARTIAPLLSFEASGAIAKTQVYASWKGRPYARRYSVPSNPKTASQLLTRNVFRWLNDTWKYLPTDATEAWQAYADASQITDRNGWIKQNLANLRSEVAITDIIMSVAARGGIVAQAMALAPAALQITVDLTEPLLPDGWTIVQANALAMVQQDPHIGTDFNMVYGSDLVAPYSIVLGGLTAATAYVVGGWFTFLRPDGKNAFGISLQDVAATP